MVEISVRSNLVDFRREVQATKGQVRFAEVVALTRTAKDAREAAREEMRRVFDRPTPYSLNAFEVKPATKADLSAQVRQKVGLGGSSPRHWFHPEVFGGPRTAKAFESALAARMGLPIGSTFFVPGPAAKLDRYGNLSGGQLGQILSDVGARRDAAQNATAKSRKRNKRERYKIFGRPGSSRFIYLGSGRDMRIALVAVTRAPVYAARFDFFGATERAAIAAFPNRLAEALDRYAD